MAVTSSPTPASSPASFYITGGTLPPESSSYVTRQADTDLYENLLAGEYCYVLNSRQMGKSSLCVRTIGRLQAAGVQTAFVDLTKFGGKNLSAEQWYAGLLSEIGREFGARTEFLTYWKEHGELSPLQRLFGALQEVALPKLDAPLIVFVDEIDVTRSLPFSTDEFFAAIRQLYVGRATNPALKRLAFCLLGTATPAELIQDTRVSPFNIGKRIDLQDFTPEEAAPLANGLNLEDTRNTKAERVNHGEHGEKTDGASSPLNAQRSTLNAHSFTLNAQRSMLTRVLFWTNGHPYLTQRLCRAIVESTILNPQSTIVNREVDRLCNELFLTHKAKESDDNLAFVRNRLLKSEADLAGLLDLYGRMRAGKRVSDDETNPLCAILKLSGVARVEDGLLKVRNRIYAHVFDRQWVIAHTPDAELRRQRQAFRRGTLLTGGIAGAVLVIVASLGLLSWRNYRLAQAQTALATRRAEEADYNLYVADMNLIQRDWDNGNVTHALDLLEATRRRGQGTFEWGYWNRLCHLELLTLKGHSDTVQAVAYSPDGTRIATGGVDQTVRVWDAMTGKCLHTLTWHSESIFLDYTSHLMFSPNGTNLLTCDFHDVRLWDVTTGKEQKRFKPGLENIFYSAAFSPDGMRIVITNLNAVTVRDAATGKELLELKAPRFLPTSAAFSPDGRRIVTASQDQTVRVWDALTSKALLIIRGNMDHRSFPVAFSPDGKHLVTGMHDHTAQMWDAQTGKPQIILTGSSDSISDIAFTADGRRIATGGSDGVAKVWDMRTGKCLLTLKGHAGSVSAVAFSPDGKRFVTCGDNMAKVWDATTDQTYLTLGKPSLSMYKATFSPDGTRIVTLGEKGSTAWDTATGKALLTRKLPSVKDYPIGLSPDGSHMAFKRSYRGVTVLTWESVAGIQQRTFRGEEAANLVVFSPDGMRIAMFEGNTVRILDTATGKELITFHRHQSAFFSSAFSPDGKYIATASRDNIASVWDSANGGEIKTFRGHEGMVTAVAFSPDGKRIATGSSDQTAKIWDGTSGRCLLTLKGHANTLNSVAFSGDGKRLLTSSDDRTAKVWDATTGADLLTLKGHTGPVNAAAFSPDGKRIVTSSQDGTAKVWFADDTRLAPPK